MSDSPYIIEMRHITKVFGTNRANDDITLQLKKGEIHALLGENGAGKSTLMSVLFGLYDPDEGEIYKNGEKVTIKDPNDATALGIGMVHQHFKLVECFSVLDNIILGKEDTKAGFLQKKTARAKVRELSEKYGLYVDLDAIIEDITVGMQQRTEILKMLYRDNEILIFDEPTAVLTPQEIEELMQIMRNLAAEGKSILFITHKLNEIMEVADRCSVLRKGKYIGTVNVADTTKEDLSEMMVGHMVKFAVDKEPAKPAEPVLQLKNLIVKSKTGHKNAVNDVSFTVRAGEIVCIAGIDGNGQTELGYAITGLEKTDGGSIIMCGEDITRKNVRYRCDHGMSHIPEDRHKHGLILDFTLRENMVLRRYLQPEFQNHGFIKFKEVRDYAEKLTEEFDVRSSDGVDSTARSMSGGNQQKAIVARELDHEHKLLVAIQPTRGLDVGAIIFVVYGYMCRGEHEGENGLACYRFSREKNTLEEMAYLSTEHTFEIIKNDIDRLCVKKDNQIYLLFDDTVFSIDERNNETAKIIEGAAAHGFIANPAQSAFAWMQEIKDGVSSKLQIRYLDTGETQIVSVPSDKYVLTQGFIEGDFIYTVGSRSDIGRLGFGRIYPQSELIIADENGEKVGGYKKEAVYISRVTAEDGKITLERIKADGGAYTRIEDEILIQSDKEVVKEEKLLAAGIVERRGKIRRYVIKKATKYDECEVFSPNRISYAKEAVRSDTHDGRELFYGYEKGRLKGVFEKAGEAITAVMATVWDM